MSVDSSHDIYLDRCVQLAQNAGKNTLTNPLVGAVIVYRDIIIGEGFHERYGGPHAEIMALESVSPANRPFLKDATLYVSLEPCSHHGKTPPCAHRIVKENISSVVVAVTDPNPLVSGRGIQYLKSHGVNVILHPHQGCRDLLERFYIHLTGKAFVTLKWAQTSDFYIGMPHQKTIISESHTQVLVHKWRSEHQGILVGKNTVITDLPTLNVRHYPGEDPVRIILDTHLNISEHNPVFRDGIPTLIVNQHKEGKVQNLNYIKVSDTRDTDYLLQILFDLKIYSVLVEGGAEVHQSFIQTNQWHKACVITNTQKLHQGIKAPALTGHLQHSFHVGKDYIQIITNKSHYE